jgi:PhoPQ-activated pathogenicity-related protein
MRVKFQLNSDDTVTVINEDQETHITVATQGESKIIVVSAPDPEIVEIDDNENLEEDEV